MGKQCLSTVISLFLAGMAMPLLATDEPIDRDAPPQTYHDTIVVTASAAPDTVKNVAGSIEVITAEEIEAKGAETIADAVEDAVALSLSLVPGRGQMPQIRGLGNRRTLLLINGMRIATDFRDSSVDLTLYSAEIIERIEIVRGPVSALYGSEAMGGAINVITRRIPDTVGGGITLRYAENSEGALETPSVRGFFGGRLGKLGYQLIAHYREQDRFDIDPDDSFTDFDDEERQFGQIDLDYELDAGHRLSAGFQASENNRIGYRYKNKEHTDRDADSDRDHIYLQYDAALANGDLLLRSYRSTYVMDRQYIGQRVQEYFDIENRMIQHEARLSNLEVGDHILAFGMEYRDEKRSGVENRGEVYVDRSVRNAAVLAQDTWSLGERFSLTAGLRFDDSSDFGSELTPRLAGVWKLTDHVRMKAYYGEGFRAPSVYELYVETVNNKENTLPNPDLEPERSQSYELSLEGESGPFAGAVRVFHNDLEDAIEKVRVGFVDLGGPNPTPQYQRLNVDEATTQGLEVETRLYVAESFSLVLNGALMDSENEQTGEALFNVPEEKAHLGLEYDNPDSGWRAKLRFNYVGEQLASLKGTTGTEADAYTMVDLYVARSFADRFQVFAGIDNVFDEELEHMPEEGTVVYTGFSARF